MNRKISHTRGSPWVSKSQNLKADLLKTIKWLESTECLQERLLRRRQFHDSIQTLINTYLFTARKE